MTVDEIRGILSSGWNSDHNFADVTNPLHPRPDLCAMLLIDKLVPKPGKDIVSDADHEIIVFNATVQELAESATHEDIITLRHCGVFESDEGDCLAMFI